MEKLYENIKRRREELGLSQAELGRRTGYSRGAIWKIERGDFNIPLEKLKLIAAALHTTPIELTEWGQLTEREELIAAIDGMDDRQITLLLAFIKTMGGKI